MKDSVKNRKLMMEERRRMARIMSLCRFKEVQSG